MSTMTKTYSALQCATIPPKPIVYAVTRAKKNDLTYRFAKVSFTIPSAHIHVLS